MPRARSIDWSAKVWQNLYKESDLRREKVNEVAMVEGLLEGIAAVLEIRFGPASVPILAEIETLNISYSLRQILTKIKTTPPPEHLSALGKRGRTGLAAVIPAV